ncbi:MAG: hypothetical protein DDT19_02509 [Syntrophomonadaceae bacterium]|nr:hypothetical protein [Bacillota bacterium]
MKLETGVFAYIDAANLHRGIKSLGWELDYARFRVWLSDKYRVSRAYLFIGLIPKYTDLYTTLQEAGFTLVFKEVIYDGEGKAKGNCDADLVTQAMKDSYEGMVAKAVLVASDGDYTPLVKFLCEKNQMEVILSPALYDKCSILLKRTGAKISYLNDQRNILRVQK